MAIITPPLTAVTAPATNCDSASKKPTVQGSLLQADWGVGSLMAIITGAVTAVAGGGTV